MRLDRFCTLSLLFAGCYLQEYIVCFVGEKKQVILINRYFVVYEKKFGFGSMFVFVYELFGFGAGQMGIIV